MSTLVADPVVEIAEHEIPEAPIATAVTVSSSTNGTNGQGSNAKKHPRFARRHVRSAATDIASVTADESEVTPDASNIATEDETTLLNTSVPETGEYVHVETGALTPGVQETSVVNILMVDDHVENLIALEATLQEIKKALLAEETPIVLNLVRAMSGAEALRRLLSEEYAVILLDVQMPGMDGYETASLIRQRGRSQHTPIIFLTAINTSDSNVSQGYSLGAVDYLFKPFQPQVLRAKVSVFIDLYLKTQEVQRMADESRQHAALLRTSNDELAKTNKIMGGLYRELERKSSELTKERDFIDAILDTAGSYLLIFDRTGKLERCNKVSEELSGMTQEQLRGTIPWETLVVEEDRDKVKDAFTRVAVGEDAAPFEICVHNATGALRRLSMTFTGLYDGRDRLTNVIASGVDITERYEAEEQIKRMNEDLERRVLERTRELQEANRDLQHEVAERRKAETALKQAKETAEYANSAKDQFLAVLSHELRTPLTPVLAIVQMLDEDSALPDELRSWVQTIGRNVQLEARLIDDLLDLTRISNGKLQLNLETVETHRLIHETVAICAEDIKHKCLSIELDLQAQETRVNADPARLHQVLWNLVKNAVKFTPEGGTITVRTENTPEGNFRCTVVDTGIGIPADHLSRVFNAFDQGDKTITRRFGGLGLGLAISRALVEQHGGSIHAESEGPNKGAKFMVELPAIDLPHVAMPDKASTGGRRTDAPQVHSAARILLVEDNKDTSQALRVLLERKGFAVVVAHSVASAVEIAQKSPYDLVISDIGLPDGTGVDVLRKLNLIRPTRAIAMSGFGMEEDVQRSLNAGFLAHLVKPINFDQLNETLQQMLVTT